MNRQRVSTLLFFCHSHLIDHGQLTCLWQLLFVAFYNILALFSTLLLLSQCIHQHYMSDTLLILQLLLQILPKTLKRNPFNFWQGMIDFLFIKRNWFMVQLYYVGFIRQLQYQFHLQKIHLSSTLLQKVTINNKINLYI